MNDNFAMTIDGRAVTTAATIEVRNPATGEVFAAAPDASAAELDAAVAAATRAFPAWRDTPLADRKASLVKAAEAIETHADELAALFVREQGRPLPDAKMEILGAAMWMKATTMLACPST